MHRSRIGIVLIDQPAGSYDSALAFWGGVQGLAPEATEDEEYARLGRIGSVHLEGQRTGEGTPPRVHLDIESDDVAAEVARVVALGARVVEDRGDYVILDDPGGLVFCVVPVQTAERFEADALTWP